jgi:hypothetical protein
MGRSNSFPSGSQRAQQQFLIFGFLTSHFFWAALSIFCWARNKLKGWRKRL